MIKIRYVGKKAQRVDNVGGSNTVWNGQGDVQAVPDSAAAALLSHPTVWELADTDVEEPKPLKLSDAGGQGEGEGGKPDGTSKEPKFQMQTSNGPLDLSALDRDQLAEIAKEQGVSHHHKAGAEKIAAALSEAFPVESA